MQKLINNNLIIVLLFIIITPIIIPSIIFHPHAVFSWDFYMYLEIAKMHSDGGIIYKHLGDLKSPLFLYFITFTYNFYKIIFGGVSPNITIYYSIIYWAICSLSAFLLYYIISKLYKNNRTIAFISSIILLFTYTTNPYTSIYINQPCFSILAILIFTSILVKKQFDFNSRNTFIFGILLGIVFLSSTIMIAYTLIIPIMIYYKYRNLNTLIKSSTIATIGFLIPTIIIVGYYLNANALKGLIFWNYKYPLSYDNYPFYYKIYGLINTKEFGYEMIAYSFINVLSILLIISLIYRIYKNKKFDINSTFIISMALLSLLSRLLLSRNGSAYAPYLVIFQCLPIVLYYRLFIINSNKLTKRIASAICFIFLLVFATDYMKYNPIFKKVRPANSYELNCIIEVNHFKKVTIKSQREDPNLGYYNPKVYMYDNKYRNIDNVGITEFPEIVVISKYFNNDHIQKDVLNKYYYNYNNVYYVLKTLNPTPINFEECSKAPDPSIYSAIKSWFINK